MYHQIALNLAIFFKDISKATKHEPRKQRGELLGMLLDILRVTLLENISSGPRKKGPSRGKF